MHDLDLVQKKRFSRKLMIRKFTVRAIYNCEMFSLTIEELEKMKMEFPEIHEEMFKGAFEMLHKQFELKIEMIKRENEKIQRNAGIASILGSTPAGLMEPGTLKQNLFA